MALNPMTCVLIKRRYDRETEEVWLPDEERVRDRSYAGISQGTPRVAKSC